MQNSVFDRVTFMLRKGGSGRGRQGKVRRGRKENAYIHICLYILQSISWKNTFLKKGNGDFQGRELRTQRIGVGDFSLSTHLYFLNFGKWKCIVSIQSCKRIFECLFTLIPFSLHCLQNSSSGFLPCGVQPLHADFKALMFFLENNLPRYSESL